MQWHGPLQELVESRLGFRQIGAHFATLVVPWLERLAAETASPPERVVARLTHAPADDPELLGLIDRVTINETSFMRHRAQLEAVVTRSVDLHARVNRPLQVWCAGCSTGEEAWSIAMLFETAGVPVNILASDVDERVLGIARAAAGYGPSAMLHLTVEERDRYLVPQGDRYAVVDEIAGGVTWLRHNLFTELAPRPAVDGWDLILCRNVFIYFTDVAMAATVRQMFRVLAPDGALVLGASETLAGIDVPLKAVQMGIHIGKERSTREADGSIDHEEVRGERGWTNYYRSSS